MQIVLLFLFLTILLRLLVRLDAALLDGLDELHDPLLLVLAGQEPPLGLGCRTQGHLLNLRCEPLDGVRVRVVALGRDLAHLELAQQLELVLAEVQRLAGLRVCQAGPSLGDLYAVEEVVEGVTGGRAHDLLAVDGVANVRVRVVERERDVADCVGALVGVRVVRVVYGINVLVDISCAAIGVRLYSVVGTELLVVVKGTVGVLLALGTLAVGGDIVAG